MSGQHPMSGRGVWVVKTATSGRESGLQRTVSGPVVRYPRFQAEFLGALHDETPHLGSAGVATSSPADRLNRAVEVICVGDGETPAGHCLALASEVLTVLLRHVRLARRHRGHLRRDFFTDRS